MVNEKPVPEKCEKCQENIDDMISIKDGKRCRHTQLTHHRREGATLSAYGPWDGCALFLTAKCGHRTNVLKYNGKCIGATNCSDFEPKPWWMFWK
jgi:hypothetical protein